jgi:hypothetical protein
MFLLLCAYAGARGVACEPPAQAAAAASAPEGPTDPNNSVPASAPQAQDSAAGATRANPPTSSTAEDTPATVPRLATAPALDLQSLEERLRNTNAIGLFTKLSLKNQVDDLLAQFKSFHNGNATVSLAELRQRFELLLMKVVTLLQDDDPGLAAAVSSSREAIWAVLSDPKKFANL